MIDKIAIMNRARIQKRRDRDIFVRKTAVELFEKYKDIPLFISGVVLYWAEGTRLNKNYRKYQLAFTNSDSNLTIFYCGFLREYFKNIDRKDWRVGLFLYPDIKIDQAMSYWSNALNIPCVQFIKSQILPSNKRPDKKLEFGTCCVYINSKDACLTMQAWIEAINSMRR